MALRSPERGRIVRINRIGNPEFSTWGSLFFIEIIYLYFVYMRFVMNTKAVESIIPDWKKTGATLEQVRFAACYLANNFDEAQAWAESGSVSQKRKPDLRRGRRMLRTPEVQTLLDLYVKDFLMLKKQCLEKTLFETLFAQAFYDPKIFFTPDGEPAFSNWNQIPVEYRRCISGMEVKYFGKNADQKSITLKLSDRSKAIDTLREYLSFVKEHTKNEEEKEAAKTVTMTEETEAKLTEIFRGGRVPSPPADVMPKLEAPKEKKVESPI